MATNLPTKAADPAVVSDLLKRLRDVERNAKTADENFSDELDRISAIREKLRKIAQHDLAANRSAEDRKADRDAMRARLEKLRDMVEKAGVKA